MATLIHILSKAGQDLTVAAYYPVPVAIYDEQAVDATRVPASNRLTTAEVNDVKLGRIFEILQTVDVSGKDEAQVKTFLVQRYNSGESAALAKYSAMYSSYVDEAWDGSGWT